MPGSPANPRPSPTQSFRPFPREAIEGSIVARFEHQVDEHAQRMAVRSSEHSLTYRELNDWANRIAHLILDRLGERSEPVGLLIEQGAALLAAILGVLKSGKMYLPLDPYHPPARNALIFHDAGAALLLADRTNAASALGFADAHASVLNIDDVDASGSTTNPRLSLSGDTHAYIFHTSGSTGQPKGVYDTHRNVLHNIMRYTNSLHIACDDRLTLLQSANFSGSVSSLFSGLLNGASVFPYDLRRQGMGSNLAEWLGHEGLTMYHSVPAIFRSALNSDLRFPAMRIIRLEGDAASRIDVELFRKHFESGCLLVNGLGATETGLTRQFFMDHETPLPRGVVPIGYPTTDMQARVVDELLAEVPRGEIGEIVIQSRYLAAGYWRNPEMTRAAFLADPGGSDERVYRTGDQGRMRDDDCLEYVGRKDRQLKIRGHRVDPAEVEGALLHLGAFREAVVNAVAGESGASQLVAYVVPVGSHTPTTSEIRDDLAATLPDFLIPSRVIALEALPLDENGKVDRRRLPSPTGVPLERSVEHLAPRTPLEREIAGIWEAVLKVRSIGVKDNFFDLGGDSMSAATVCAAIGRMLAIDPPLSLIAEIQTIEGLAEVLQRGARVSRSALVPIQTRGTRPPFFCVHAHHGNVLSFAALSRELGVEQPFYGLQSTVFAPDELLDVSLAGMAQRYLDELRLVQPHGPYHLGGFCLGGVVALEMARQLEADGEQVAHLILIDNNPTEFPGIVPDEAIQRFQRHLMKRRLDRHSTEVARRGTVRGIGYLAGGAGKKILGRLWRVGVGAHLALRLPLPDWLRSVERAHRHALAAHASGRCSCRVTFVQPAEDRELFARNPTDDWGALAAGGYSVHYVQGAKGAFFRAPYVQELAATIAKALGEPRA